MASEADLKMELAISRMLRAGVSAAGVPSLSPTAAGGNSRIASLEVLERELDAATRITSRIQRVRITNR